MLHTIGVHFRRSYGFKLHDDSSPGVAYLAWLDVETVLHWLLPHWNWPNPKHTWVSEFEEQSPLVMLMTSAMLVPSQNLFDKGVLWMWKNVSFTPQIMYCNSNGELGSAAFTVSRITVLSQPMHCIKLDFGPISHTEHTPSATGRRELPLGFKPLKKTLLICCSIDKMVIILIMQTAHWRLDTEYEN